MRRVPPVPTTSRADVNVPHAVLRAMSIAAAAMLAGCAAFSPDGGMDAVQGIVGSALNKDVVALRTPEDAEIARAGVVGLLKLPLSADAAVQIALLNNRGLQAAYNELAVAEARRVGQSLPPNPSISLLRISGPAEIEIEKQIVANILALATLPARSEIALTRFRQAQLRAAEETLRIAAQARRAYYRAVAARELVGFLAQAQTAAETATKLATRLGETGAMNKLDQAREQVFYAELTAQLATARQRASSEREALARWLGLWGNDLDFKLPNALPPLPRHARALPATEVEAVRRRVDLQVARMELDALARTFGLTQATRFINLLEAGYAEKTIKDRETGETHRLRGFDLELQIPLFDFGEVRVREAEATYMQAVNRLAERAVNVRSEARDAYRAYRSTYDIAAHYRREVLPLRKIISDETLLRYNAMMIDVFSVLAEARQRIAATVAGIEAQRNFWLAMTDLGVAVVGGGVSGGVGEETRGPRAAAEPSGGAPGH
jgi:outer membrane protein TolC